MGISVKKIPSINVPFTDESGRINPIWHEFLRQFVASGDTESGGTTGTAVSVIAGQGLTGGGELSTDVTLNIGAGNGLAVNANDIGVDINGQTDVLAALDDELLLSDKSDNNTIRKTSVRNVMKLSAPGGLDTYVQYNDNGIFGGDSGLLYDKAGKLTLSTVATASGDLSLTPQGSNLVVLNGTAPVITGASGSATSAALSFAGNNVVLYGTAANATISAASTGWTLQPGSGKTLQLSTSSGMLVTGMDFKMADSHLKRSVSAAVTASTTQTQGQGALVADYNNVATVANANDTVTLPSAIVGEFCVVRNNGANVLKIFPASGNNLGAGSNTSVTLSPGAHYTWFAIDSTNWHQLDGEQRNTVASGITASTTQTQGQQPLTKDVNQISVVANANDTVTLPTAPSYSRSVRIINSGANTIKIYPASGDNLGAGVDTSTTLASGANVCYTNYDATNWKAI